MGIFSTLVGRTFPAAATQPATALEDVSADVPARLEAVAELLLTGRDARAACGVVGRELARDGADLGEAFEALRVTCERTLRREPTFGEAHALSLAWGEETLGYAHQVSCEDPLTGLASLAHLRARLSESYRGCAQRGALAEDQYALIVVDLPLLTRPATREQVFSSALGLVRITETLRESFPGDQCIARISPSRLIVFTERHDALGRRTALLRHLLSDATPVAVGVRVWVEGLPSSDDAAAWLLDELTRH